MRKTISLKQIEANRRNAAKSTGPKTQVGKAFSRMNALNYGLRSAEVVVNGRCIKESPREFAALHRRLCEDLKPVGQLEEILVGQIITTVWRLRRVHKAESGEIALSVDCGQSRREIAEPLGISFWIGCAMHGGADSKLEKSSDGNTYLRHVLWDLRESIEKEGEISETALKNLVNALGGKPNPLTMNLERLRSQLCQNSEGLEPLELKRQALTCIDRKLESIALKESKCRVREESEEQARQAAAVLPSAEILEKLLRFEGALQKKLYRSINYLERLQRRRQGENIPAPVAMEISTGT